MQELAATRSGKNNDLDIEREPYPERIWYATAHSWTTGRRVDREGDF